MAGFIGLEMSEERENAQVSAREKDGDGRMMRKGW
jgi:hypothetical protein